MCTVGEYPFKQQEQSALRENNNTVRTSIAKLLEREQRDAVMAVQDRNFGSVFWWKLPSHLKIDAGAFQKWLNGDKFIDN